MIANKHTTESIGSSSSSKDNSKDNFSVISVISISKIINDILDRKILEILKQINNVYPDKFPKKNINLEFEFIKNNIKLSNYSGNKIIQANKKTEQTIIDNKKKQINGRSSKSSTKSSSKPISKCNIESQNRCKARVWNNIYDRNTLKEVSDIDKKFKVKDFIEIKIKEFHGKYIVGTQCRRKKSEDNIYCGQHKKHCPHGNYFEIPPKELCLHYMKDGNYL
jgi:hypothetical protein